jgi:hypothetical protein
LPWVKISGETCELIAIPKKINKKIIDERTTKTSKQVLIEKKSGETEWVNIDQVLGL